MCVSFMGGIVGARAAARHPRIALTRAITACSRPPQPPPRTIGPTADSLIRLALGGPYRAPAERPWMKHQGLPRFSDPVGGNSFLSAAQRRDNLGHGVRARFAQDCLAPLAKALAASARLPCADPSGDWEPIACAACF